MIDFSFQNIPNAEGNKVVRSTVTLQGDAAALDELARAIDSAVAGTPVHFITKSL